MTLAAVLCCAMVSVLFTSCSKDDDNSDSDLYSYVAVLADTPIVDLTKD